MVPSLSDELMAVAESLLQLCQAKKIKLTAAESCTGGLVIAALTSIPGSSSVVDRGFITYSNQAKIDMLDVHPQLIAEFGAVSTQVASAMAMGAMNASNTQISLAITGIAGPDGGSQEKPVGTVHIAVAAEMHIRTFPFLFSGTRNEIRHKAAIEAIKMAEEMVRGGKNSPYTPWQKGR